MKVTLESGFSLIVLVSGCGETTCAARVKSVSLSLPKPPSATGVDLR